ncbi:MAG: hypothetical protein LBL51_05450 [Synergistaceae bacterium]|jgi:hypothetical protein|nr:hypothetical protein [Synergistaceae bacterium]
MTQEKGQEERRIWEKYRELLSEEEKAVLRAAQPQNAFQESERCHREAKETSDKLNFLEYSILSEIQMRKFCCKCYLSVIAYAWYFNLGRNANVLFSFVFVLCIWRILSRRRRNYLDNNCIQKSCLYLSVVFLVWTLQVICYGGPTCQDQEEKKIR